MILGILALDMTPRWRRQVTGRLPSIPPDLAAVVGLVAVLFVVSLGETFVPDVIARPLRIVTGLSFVLFVPGYALVAALFPRGRQLHDDTAAGSGRESSPITGIERAALSVGVSAVVVPLIGYLLNFTLWGIRERPTVLAVGAFTVVAAVVASYRRTELPPNERFTMPYGRWIAGWRSTLLDPADRTDGVLNVVLVVSVLLAVSSIGYAVTVPRADERSTELYLLTQNQDGDLVAAADGYPRTFTAGEPRSLYVGVENREHRRLRYTLLVMVQNVTSDGSGSQIHQTERIRTFRVALQHNEVWQANHTVAPTLTGDRLRLIYLLYRGEPPATPTIDDAYRTVHLWVNVSMPSGNRTASVSGGRARLRTVPVTVPYPRGQRHESEMRPYTKTAASSAGGYEDHLGMFPLQSEPATMNIESIPGRRLGREDDE